MKRGIRSQKDCGWLSRRQFIKGTTTAAAFVVVPRGLLSAKQAVPPSERINLAIIGVGGQGTHNMKTFMQMPDVQIVAVCDVVKRTKFRQNPARGMKPALEVLRAYYGAKTNKETYKDFTGYDDFRQMFADREDIDAVVVATPDHWHALITIKALDEKKHIYCQKPMTHTILEARIVARTARRIPVATQMGNQGHSNEGVRLLCEWIWAGAIGDVRQVHAWTTRPCWPQALLRPEEKPHVPSDLDWDMWLGPAPYRAYNPAYVPFKWRGWWDFGCGALGDMGCHVLDAPYWALKLNQPVSVEASCPKRYPETAPIASIVHYEFGSRQGMPAVSLTWYDGGLKPPRPKELEKGRQMGDHYGGLLFIGDKGKIMSGYNGDSPRIIPEGKMRKFKRPPKTIPRVQGGHERDFITACKTGKEACSNFDYAGPLTEIVQVGNLAVRTEGRLYWDGENMRVTNNEDANKYVHMEYRSHWKL